jgi:hypothetical protein
MVVPTLGAMAKAILGRACHVALVEDEGCCCPPLTLRQAMAIGMAGDASALSVDLQAARI